MPVTIVDRIEDSQLLPCAPTRVSHRQSVTQRAGTSVPKKHAHIASPARFLRGQSSCLHSAKPGGLRQQRSEESEFALCSDGFVGAELRIQLTESVTRQRTTKTQHPRKGEIALNELNLAFGNLPAPPSTEYEEASTSETQLTAGEGHRRCGEPRLIERGNLINEHLPTTATPSVHLSKDSCSRRLDEDATSGHISCSSSNLNDKNSFYYEASSLPQTISPGHVHISSDDSMYFEELIPELNIG